eukprot:SAG31_NODE_9919_length_1209_cov_1.387039_1_plen_315_part_01
MEPEPEPEPESEREREPEPEREREPEPEPEPEAEPKIEPEIEPMLSSMSIRVPTAEPVQEEVTQVSAESEPAAGVAASLHHVVVRHGSCMDAGLDHADLLSCAPIRSESGCAALSLQLASAEIDNQNSGDSTNLGESSVSIHLRVQAVPWEVPLGCLLHGPSLKFNGGRTEWHDGSREHTAETVSCSEEWGCVCTCSPASAEAETELHTRYPMLEAAVSDAIAAEGERMRATETAVGGATPGLLANGVHPDDSKQFHLITSGGCSDQIQSGNYQDGRQIVCMPIHTMVRCAEAAAALTMQQGGHGGRLEMQVRDS